jgi:hypothetical protein
MAELAACGDGAMVDVEPPARPTILPPSSSSHLSLIVDLFISPHVASVLQ